MKTRQSKLPLMCYLCFIILHLCNLPLTSSQQITDNNCIAAPCTYRGECRDRSGVCGDTAAHCNTESFWVPACGGGAGLEKPLTNQATRRPTPRPTTPSFTKESSASPTTAWELWISNKDKSTSKDEEEEKDEDRDGGVIGYTTGKEGDENHTPPSNEPDEGFDAETWGYYGEEKSDDEGILDKMGNVMFGDDNSAMEASKTELVFLVSVVLAILL